MEAVPCPPPPSRDNLRPSRLYSIVIGILMSTTRQGSSGPSGSAGSRPTPRQPLSGNYTTPKPMLTRLEQQSQERLISNQIRKLTDSVEVFLEQHKESSVTKETIVTLLERLDRLGLGMDDGDVVYKQESTRSDALLIVLKQIEGKLRDVSGHIESMGYVGGGEDAKTVSELMDYIRAAVADCQRLAFESSVPGESPPPPPRACFGRDDLIEKVIGLAENLIPIALIGVGGIGKTSIALAVLHHDRIKKRFGSDRRFIRCDQFPASRTHFLSRLSKVVGAGVENPEDLTPLRPFLSSREMILFLDNAESLLDPQGTDAREILAVVEELSRFQTICLCVTSRISTVPRHCKRPIIPTLSMESACDIFYDIYDNGGRSDIINNLMRRLDFHALSITLLATTASHNMWDHGRLAREWDTHRVQVLRTDYDESLAATIELSLASPTFHKLGPDARNLLGVIAFFPQGVNENNLDWLFPTIPNRRNISDKLCVLSLTHRSNGFITMLAPLRDYLRPKDLELSPLLCTTKDHYFSRLLVRLSPGDPGFEETQWVILEDVNIEHLLDVFTTVDANSGDVWDICCCFIKHLYWHKPRPVVLGPKIEKLPDHHRFKPKCLFQLSQLFCSVGNPVECKRLLTRALKIWRERGDDLEIANALGYLSDANRLLGLHKEGICQAKEALGIFKRLDDKLGQAHSYQWLAWLSHADDQLDAAEEAASRAIDLLSDKSEQFLVCGCHRLLGEIYNSKGKVERAINHFEMALGIASSFNWQDEQFWTHYSLAKLFLSKNRLDDAHTHTERAKLHAINDAYLLGRMMQVEARIWWVERRFEEAKPEFLRALDVFKKLGAAKDVEYCRVILRQMEEEMKKLVVSGESSFDAHNTERHPAVLVSGPISHS